MSAGSTSGVPGDIVGVWKVHLPDGIHDIELEHGTATGKRIIRVDGKEVKGQKPTAFMKIQFFDRP